MEIRIKVKRGIKDSGLRPQVERLLRFALGRFVGRISTVVVTLEDENGPKGGVDKLCRLKVIMTGEGERKKDSTVVIVERCPSVLEAVSLAADRAARNVGRLIDRQRLTKKGAVSASGD